MDALWNAIDMTLQQAIEQANDLTKPLASFLRRVGGCDLMVGFSGGADSSMLLLCLAHLAPRYGVRLQAVHVHHGLMQEADDWVRRCQDFANLCQLPLHVRYVSVDRASGKGLEAAARQARYEAFASYARENGCYDVALAHHLQDQAETLLLRLLRGTGVQGMGGMAMRSTQCVDGVSLVLHRPWLTVPRTAMMALAREVALITGWHPIEDPSNGDTRYKRGAVRQGLVPVLERYWPSWKENLARHADLMHATQGLVEEIAQSDFEACRDGEGLSLTQFRQLSPLRQANVLRYYLSLKQLKMPTQHRLNEWLKQFNTVHQNGTDRHIYLAHEGYYWTVKKGQILFIESAPHP